MLIFLYGPDTYRLRQKQNEIIQGYKKIHKSGFNLKIIEASKLSFQDFEKEFYTSSMFKEKKLMVLKEVSLNEKLKNELLKKIKKLADSDNVILFCEEGKTLKDKFFNSLKKHGEWQEFKLLEKPKLKNWVKKEFNKQLADIEPGALDLLVDYVGNDLWQMANEIKKLANYKQKIEVENVRFLVKPKIETDIFKTIDAIASKNKKLALELINKHLEKGDSPLYLLTMITFQFRNLLLVKSFIPENSFDMDYASTRTLTDKLKLHPYVVKKSVFQARKFTFLELKKIYRKIFQVDLDIKTGKLDPEAALELFIAEA